MKKTNIICTDNSRSAVNPGRRKFIRFASVAGVTLVAGASGGRLLAQVAAVKVSEADTTAQMFGYVHDSTKVDTVKFPRHVNGQVCEQCALYAAKTEGWGSCAIFPGKLVAAEGWCNAFAQRPGS